MPDVNDSERLSEILTKILTYQHRFPDGRAVELDELRREGVLSAADDEFMRLHSVTYKPHRLSDYHAGDTLHMPTDGGCVFMGPSGPPLKKRRASLSSFQPIVEGFLKLPRAKDELLLHIELTEHDGMAVAPEGIFFNFRSPEWRRQLPLIRSVASEFDLQTFQDEEVQGSWTLTFGISRDPARTAGAVVALLRRGCEFTDESQVIYSAGALDEAQG